MKRWYLLYCKRGEQPRARLNLENQGVECYYPEICVEKVQRGKKKVVHEPLFPSYMFIRFDFEVGPTFTTIRSTRGVIDFVRFGPQPKEIEGDLIVQLKQTEPEMPFGQSQTMPQKGQRIYVSGGQFAGIDAIYQEPDGDKRSIMLVKMINQNVEMSIDNKDLFFE